jgi:hypothetical protein
MLVLLLVVVVEVLEYSSDHNLQHFVTGQPFYPVGSIHRARWHIYVTIYNINKNMLTK